MASSLCQRQFSDCRSKLVLFLLHISFSVCLQIHLHRIKIQTPASCQSKIDGIFIAYKTSPVTSGILRIFHILLCGKLIVALLETVFKLAVYVLFIYKHVCHTNKYGSF